MNALVIYGLGNFARMMRYYFSNDSKYDVVAYCADRKFITDNVFDELPVVSFEDVQDIYSCVDFVMFVAAGYSKMRTREIMFNKALSKKYHLATYISSKANVDNSVEIGVNNVVLQDTQIEPFCKIGENNILWSSVNISHDVEVGSHCFIASQSLIGGFSSIGDGSFVGFNSTVLQNIVLAKETLVGAKTLVLEDTAPFSRNIGIPSKCVGFHFEEGIFVK